ncbi:hypothetical protein BC941DRAFT_408019 [Chlamydoabsidia padenii]|nr:hypothetical protein BC941DRAFT_408019 [Chlamydoabsidia padenii]
MRFIGLISILFLTFESAYPQSCITNYKSDVYRFETNATTIKAFKSDIPHHTNKSTIPWKFDSETQPGAASLFSCITVHQFAFLLITPANKDHRTQETRDINIVAYNYDSHLWHSVPLDLRLIMHPWTLLAFAWRQQYIIYNTQRKMVYYFNTQTWSWYSSDDQRSFLAPSTPTTTTPEITVVSTTMYYLYNDDTDAHKNHIYMFDLPTGKWKGYFASFWSNTSSFVLASSALDNALYVIPRSNNFKDRLMRTIHLGLDPPILVVQTPAMSLPNSNTLISLHSIQGRNGEQVEDGLILCNDTTLVFYQPSNNTVMGIYGDTGISIPGASAAPPLPSSPPFWSTFEGRRIEVALGCSLSIGMILVTVIGMVILQRRRRRRRRHYQQNQLESAPAEVTDHEEEPQSQEEEASSHDEEEDQADLHQENEKDIFPTLHEERAPTTATETTTTLPSPSMQSLSFLIRDNAMVWGKSVHQLLAMIAFHHDNPPPTTLSRSSSDYPSMIKTSTTISALAKSSMILSIMSASSSSNSFLHNIKPPTPVQRRSLDMACPLPRTNSGQDEPSSSHLP